MLAGVYSNWSSLVISSWDNFEALLVLRGGPTLDRQKREDEQSNKVGESFVGVFPLSGIFQQHRYGIRTE